MIKGLYAENNVLFIPTPVFGAFPHSFLEI